MTTPQPAEPAKSDSNAFFDALDADPELVAYIEETIEELFATIQKEELS